MMSPTSENTYASALEFGDLDLPRQPHHDLPSGIDVREGFCWLGWGSKRNEAERERVRKAWAAAVRTRYGVEAEMQLCSRLQKVETWM